MGRLIGGRAHFGYNVTRHISVMVLQSTFRSWYYKAYFNPLPCQPYGIHRLSLHNTRIQDARQSLNLDQNFKLQLLH
jgi:hypothetical protein